MPPRPSHKVRSHSPGERVTSVFYNNTFALLTATAQVYSPTDLDESKESMASFTHTDLRILRGMRQKVWEGFRIGKRALNRFDIYHFMCARSDEMVNRVPFREWVEESDNLFEDFRRRYQHTYGEDLQKAPRDIIDDDASLNIWFEATELGYATLEDMRTLKGIEDQLERDALVMEYYGPTLREISPNCRKFILHSGLKSLGQLLAETLRKSVKGYYDLWVIFGTPAQSLICPADHQTEYRIMFHDTYDFDIGRLIEDGFKEVRGLPPATYLWLSDEDIEGPLNGEDRAYFRLHPMDDNQDIIFGIQLGHVEKRKRGDRYWTPTTIVVCFEIDSNTYTSKRLFHIDLSVSERLVKTGWLEQDPAHCLPVVPRESLPDLEIDGAKISALDSRKYCAH